jgi:aryl-alcohol dehydrogenase-like predicted oxidoreductase
MVELEVIPACLSCGVGFIPWSPLAGGMLGGALKNISEGRRASKHVQQAIDKRRAQLEAYEALCAQIGGDPATVALAWLLHNSAVTAPIIGPRTIDQLVLSLRALELKLQDSILKRLDEIWPGPGGPAPEAYAW